MKIATGRVLDFLPAEEQCLGALFMTYSFDPAFFEDHVMRSVLRLTSDPIEQAERYHHEARRALQETPVVAIVDASERRPGRRLPFDLLEVSGSVFHPKTVLLLYNDKARLLVGSGNLTFSGYGGNTELFLCAELRYHKPSETYILQSFDRHIERVHALVRRPGTQLELFRAELHRRVGSTDSDPTHAELTFLDSTTGPIIEQLKELLPNKAKITSLGLLAPFYERDDAADLEVNSVFGVLLSHMDKKAVLDVGVMWENPQVHAAGDSVLEDGLGRLWSWSYDREGERVIDHLVPISTGPNTLSYLDNSGKGRRWPLSDVRDAIEERNLWMQPSPVAFAPRNTLSTASKHVSEVRVWLHPATRLIDGRPIHRPLHAKLMVVGFRVGSTHSTIVLMGSPNMSRRALLLEAGPGKGNVELALAFRLDGEWHLRDFVPELVHAPTSAFELREREFPDLSQNYALAIDEATHDPEKQDLRITWTNEASCLPAWYLTYDGRELARAEKAPTSPLQLDDFVLSPSTSEVVLHVEGSEYSVPILVTDLIALPAAPAGHSVGLEELLMLLSHRIGTERTIQIAQRRIADRGDSELAAFFGEGFGPTDVFRAWWAVAEDLKDESLSVPAFRLRLEGTLGVGAAWNCMIKAQHDEDGLPHEEVWFYGAELLRSLGEIKLPSDETNDAKVKVLSGFCERIRKELDNLGIEVGSRPWVKRILAFYKEPTA
jgi:hypothetical protein